VAQLGVIDPQVPTERDHPQALWRSNPVNGVLHPVKQGQDIARVTGIARRYLLGKDKAASGL
jgi:hypothetical protein